MPIAQPTEATLVDVASVSTQTNTPTLPSWRQPNARTGHNRFRQIFLDHWDVWCDWRLAKEVPYDQRANVCDIVRRMMLCRDPDAGHALYVCPGCDYEIRVPFSCKTRFCPSCGKVRVDEWANKIANDLFDVRHVHITLTTDDLLRPFFHADRSLLRLLLTTAVQAVREWIEAEYPDVRLAFIYTIHTFGRDIAFKPHTHLVMPLGGLKDGKWVEITLPHPARLAAKWRYLLCKHLQQACPHDRKLRWAIARGYREHRGYLVHTDSFYPKGIEAAKYIGRYLGHPPIATSHLLDYDGQRVTYWYKDSATQQPVTVTCSALDFISRLVPHIPPKGLQIVRYAGLYARCIKRKLAEIVRPAIEAIRLQASLFDLASLPITSQRLKWRERIKRSFGYDPLECPNCGRTLELAEIWEPKRGHVWMRRWIETHRMRKIARQMLEKLRTTRNLHYRQLAFNFDP